MPTYEYECKSCHRAFEAFQSIADRPLQKCPECKGKVRRLIGRGAGIIFKGSGFYQTDYRSEHYRKQASEEKKRAESAPSAGTEKSVAKQDKKPSQAKIPDKQ